MSYCSKCGKQIPENSAVCPNCNATLQPSQPNPGATQQSVVVTIPGHRSNGLGVAGLVLSILGFFVGWIPVLGWIIWILGLLFSFIGLFKSPRGCAIAGMIISLIWVIVFVCIIGAVGGALGAALTL